MQLDRLIAISLLALSTACGTATPVDDMPTAQTETTITETAEEILESSEELICLKAASHLQGCLELDEPQVPGFCDPEMAEWTLEQSCDVLTREPSTYGWGISWNWLERLACNLGWVYYCKPEGCTQETPLDSCSDYQEFSDCQACEYYSCREAEKGLDCGDRGYFRGYGQKYCARFSAITNAFLSPAGKQWLTNVRGCLMTEIDSILEDTESCNDIRRGAFDSHPGCYVDSGLCSLPPSDWAQIFATISPWDNDLKQIILSGAGCLNEWFR